MKNAFQVVKDRLREKYEAGGALYCTYEVPSLWIRPIEPGIRPHRVAVNPYKFFLDQMEKIEKNAVSPRIIPKSGKGKWSKNAVVYNIFIRVTTAFDHDRNARIDLPVNKDGFRETGTFLKTIALLPYIQSLGINTIHLLPVTSIGHDGNKGTLGSPYAIRNPYELDRHLSEPVLELDVNTEFKAFMIAAHMLGIRVVLEFVFRTSAKDADWVREHPEWYYWIHAEIADRSPGSTNTLHYGPPIFLPEDLLKIKATVAESRFDRLLPPPAVHRSMFTEPPVKESVLKYNGCYIGITRHGERVRIPGAFSDWPPDDTQPPWGDITFLKLYDDPDFNYIAYNTVRMYDSRLAKHENRVLPLWKSIIGIIPYYQKEFNIDGVMIDMGHALPADLKQKIISVARTIDPDFAFWDEDFSIGKKNIDEGYNAVCGYLWCDTHHPSKFAAFLSRLGHEEIPIPFFATPETHNTPRAAARKGGITYTRYSMVMLAFLPGIPFIHSGYELGEHYPINTGLDFTEEEVTAHPSETLPLFHEASYDWLNRHQQIGLLAKILQLRARFTSLIVNTLPASFRVIELSNTKILAYERRSLDGKKRLVVVGNSNMAQNEKGKIPLDTKKKTVSDAISGKHYSVHHRHIEVSLHPGDAMIFEV